MEKTVKPKKIIISGGGTGGHLFPALAVGQKLKEMDNNLSITFVGSTRKLEKSIMNRYKADFIPLKIEGLKGRGLKTAKSLLLLPSALAKSYAILLKTKPSLSIGVGGYSSGPILLLSAWMRTPTLILEQNSRPGLTNRMLIPWIKKAAVSFESSLPFFKNKGICIGNPVREEFYALQPKERTEKLSLLIFGGSQGSHFLNEGLLKTLPLLQENSDKLIFYHQTGEDDTETVKQSYLDHGFQNFLVKPFFHNMASYFQKADLIISRAGATSIAEIIAGRKASILIPFAGASDNHQYLNARELEKIKSADVITEKDFSPNQLAEKITLFLTNRERLNRMEKNIVHLQKKDVTEKICNLCFDLMQPKKQRGQIG